MQRYDGYSRILSTGAPAPSATITVYLAGTLTPATIYQDDLASPTPLGNPFTADANGYFFFYAEEGRYDVNLSGGGIATAYTWGDQEVGLIANSAGNLKLQRTITAGGTTGAQTINKPAGTVNFAAGASSLVVTNSLVTANSIVLAVVRTNDATAQIKNVVPASGSFTIRLAAAATAETSVGFLVLN